MHAYQAAASPYKLKATEMAATDWAAPGSQPARMFIKEKLHDSTHFMAAGWRQEGHRHEERGDGQAVEGQEQDSSLE